MNMLASATKSPNVAPQDFDTVIKMTKLCLKEIAKVKYELNFTYAQLCANLSVHVKKIRGQRSLYFEETWSSLPTISINVADYCAGVTYLNEYASYQSSPVIGTITSCSPRTALLATVAHEVAHFIQYHCGPSVYYLHWCYKKPHGKGFKTIYRYLREAVVNPQVRADAGVTPQSQHNLSKNQVVFDEI